MMGITRGCSNNPDSVNGNQDNGAAIATVGDFKVYEKAVSEPAKRQVDPTTSTPAMIARNYGQALDNQVTSGLLLLLAKQYNVSFDDKSVLANAGSQFDDSLEMEKMQAEFRKEIPQNATEQQFEDYIKKMSGKTLAQDKQDILDRLQTQLDDPAQKSQVLAQLANSLVEKAIEGSLNVSDADVQHSQDEYNTKRIYFDAKKHSTEDMQKVAEGVLADLTSKKITFEQAMDKYSDDPPARGKAIHDNSDNVVMTTIKSDEDFRPIGDLKQGQLSTVLLVPPNGFAIYRLDSIKSNVPPDFQKNKDSLRKTYVQTIAASTLQDGLKKLRATNAIKWTAPGWDILYNWYQTTIADNSFGTKTAAEQNKIQMDFFDKGDKSDAEPGKIAAIGAIDPIWTKATPSEKKYLTPKYVDLLASVLQAHESYSGDLLLAKLAADEKKGDFVFQGLDQAEIINSNAITMPSATENFSDLAELVDKYSAANLLNADQKKQLDDAMNGFRDAEKQYELSLRDGYKQAAVAAEEAKKQAAADAAKAKAAAKAAPVKLTPGGGPLAPHLSAPAAPSATAVPGAPITVKPAPGAAGNQIKGITIQPQAQPKPK